MVACALIAPALDFLRQRWTSLTEVERQAWKRTGRLRVQNQWIDLEIDKEKDPFYDAGWDSHFEHATRIDAGNHLWTCEMRIPVNSLTAGVRQTYLNMRWRINFYRADGPGDDSQRRFLAWSTIPEGKSFHVPARFGIIRFVK